MQRIQTMKLINNYYEIMNEYETRTEARLPRNESYLVQIYASSFDMDKTTLPVTQHSLHIINTTFPNIYELKLTIKPETSPETFLTTHLINFRKLQKIQLSITDGVRPFLRPPVMVIDDLEINVKCIGDQKKMIDAMLRIIIGRKRLAITEGRITTKMLDNLPRQSLEELSIRNPIIEEKTEEIMNKLRYLRINKFEWILTHEPSMENIQEAHKTMHAYLTELPHHNLREISFTLMPIRQKFEYSQIITKLPYLEKIVIYITPCMENMDLNRLYALLNNTTNINITLKFITSSCPYTEKLLEIPIQSELILYNPNIRIEREVDSFINFPTLEERNRINLHPAFYRQAKYKQSIKTKFQSEDIKFARKMGKQLAESKTESEIVRCMNALTENNIKAQESVNTNIIQQNMENPVLHKNNHY